MEIKNRGIAAAIILSIVTLGIYCIYWFIKLTDETNYLGKPEHRTTSGGKAFLLSLVTCGIYTIYWSYRLGQKTGDMNGGNDQGVVFLLLSLFGFGIVAYALAQAELNRHAGEAAPASADAEAAKSQDNNF